MRDLIEEVNLVSTVWSRLADGHFSKEEIEKVMEHVRERLTNLNPVLSLYGAYNAGKSTLLNALIGEEIAPMGDSPETTTINEYKWGEWTIYDTPGIDAPIEHEKMTDDHLRKSECILFVISTDGDLEARLIYERLGELVQRGKPVLLVLNDKIGVLRDANPDDESAIYERIDINLNKIWEENNLAKYSKPKKLIVNAQSALKARLSETAGDPKPVLIEKSYLPILEERLEEFLRKRGANDVVNGLIDYLEPSFSELINVITKKLNNDAMQEVESSKYNIDTEKRKLLFDVEKLIRSELENLCSELRNANSNDSTALKRLVDSYLQGLADAIQQLLEKRLTIVAQQFKNEYIGTILELSSNSVISEVSVTSSDKITEGLSATIREIPKKRFVKAIENTLQKLAKNIGGKVGTTLAKSAGKIAGMAVSGIFAVFEINQAHKAQSEYEQQMRAREEAFENMVVRLRTDIHSNTMRTVREITEDFFSNILNELTKLENSLHLEHSALNDVLKELRLAQSKLCDLRVIYD